MEKKKKHNIFKTRVRGDIITFKTGFKTGLKSILKPENLDLNQQIINDLVILGNEIVKKELINI